MEDFTLGVFLIHRTQPRGVTPVSTESHTRHRG